MSAHDHTDGARSAPSVSDIRSIGMPGLLGMSALALGVVVSVVSIWPAVTAALAGGVSPGEGSGDMQQRIDAFAASIDGHTAQIDGRSAFFLPDPPPKPRVKRSPVIAPTRDSGPPPPPRRYGGPKIIGMFADQVWFSDGQVLVVEPPREDGQDDSERTRDRGLHVRSMNPPWSAMIEWKGVEFEVEFFERTTSEFLLEEPKDASDTE